MDFQNGNIILYNNDCIEILKTFADNSIDAIIIDPPYALGFMGKEWDTFDKTQFGQKGLEGENDLKNKKNFNILPRYSAKKSEYQEFCYQWAVECLRVLKPGGHLLSFAGTRTYHRLACAVEDAGFEVRDQLNWIYACLSQDSDILTDKGWKNYDEIADNDNVYSFIDGKIVKNKIKRIFNYVLENEDLIHIQNRDTDQLLTKNHRVLLQRYTSKKVDGKDTPYCKNEYEYRLAENLPARFNIPLSGVYKGSYSLGEDFVELLGWIIAEGHYHKKGGIEISQSEVNMNYVIRIEELLKKLNIKYSSRIRLYKNNKKEYRFYIGVEEAKKIKNIIPNKKLVFEFIELVYSEKLRLLKGLCEGDGNFDKNFWTFIQNDKEQLGIFQTLLHLSGYSGSIYKNEHTVGLRKTNKTEIKSKSKSVKSSKYSGIVWCVETEVGNFMARRNGKIFITGNSGFPKSLNIGKAVDRQGGQNLSWFIDYILKVADEKGISRKELTMLFPSKNGNPTGWLWNKQKTQGVTLEQYHKIKDFLNLPFENIKEAEREVVGNKTAGLGSGKTYAFTDKNSEANKEIPITKGNSEWEGWGTALKPAHEPIIMARKPLSEKTIVENVLKHGTGAIDIDGCRIPTSEEDQQATLRANTPNSGRYKQTGGVNIVLPAIQENYDPTKGRFPANIICGQGIDIAINDLLEAKQILLDNK